MKYREKLNRIHKEANNYKGYEIIPNSTPILGGPYKGQYHVGIWKKGTEEGAVHDKNLMKAIEKAKKMIDSGNVHHESYREKIKRIHKETYPNEYVWDKLNSALMRMGWQAKHIADFLFKLPKGKNVYKWDEINTALMKMGKSAKYIFDFLIRLNREYRESLGEAVNIGSVAKKIAGEQSTKQDFSATIAGVVDSAKREAPEISNQELRKVVEGVFDIVKRMMKI